MENEALEPLVLYFKISDKDYLNSMMRAGRKKALYYAIEVAWMAAAAAVVIFVQTRSGHAPLVLMFSAIPAVVFIFALYQVFVPIPMRFTARKVPRVMDPGLWKFSQQGVSWKGQSEQVSFGWGDFKELDENKEYFYLFFSEQPNRYLLFPKPYFAFEAEEKQFRKLVKQQLQRV